MSYLKDREIWLSSVPTGNPPAGYVWVFIQNGVFVVRDSNGVDKIMATTTGTVTNATSASYVEYSNVANKPALISGSSQVSFNGITDKPALVSSSAQIVGYNIFATTGSNTFQANQTITGSLFITQNLVVAGSSSIQYISSSVLDIADNIITVNAFNPAIRFGGLAVIDSGSSPQVSGSLLFDSIKDQWIFVHQNQSVVTSSVVLMGPETYNDLGNESYISANRLPKGSGVEHLRDSNITDTGTVVSINSNTAVTGSFTVVSGSAVELQVTNLGVNIGSALTDNHIISGSLRVNPNGLFVSGSGAVGIGTTSPDVFSRGDERNVGISVPGASDNLALALNAGGSAGRGAQIYMGQGGTRHFTISSNATETRVGTATSTPLILTTNDTARLTIASSTGAATFSNNVTIGQATAATNVKLILNGVVSKAAGIEFHQSGTPQWYIGNGIASEDNNFELYNSNGTMAMKIIKSTNAINFIGAATFSSSVTIAASTFLNWGARGGISQDGSFNFNWSTNGIANAFHLQSATGNVGIGTTSPSYILHAKAASGNTTGLRLESSGGTTNFDILASEGDGNAYLYQRSNYGILIGTNNSLRMTITAGGNVGINCTPSNLLEVFAGASSRGIQVYGSSSPFIMVQATNNPVVLKMTADDVGGYMQVTTNHPLIFHTNNTERMRITSGGNVGINTTNPGSNRLYVNGASYLDGYNYASSIQFIRAASDTVAPASGNGILIFASGNAQMRMNTSNQICFDMFNAGNSFTALTIKQADNTVRINSPNNTTQLEIAYQNVAYGYLGATSGFSGALLAYSVNGGYVYLRSDSTWVAVSDRDKKKNFVPYTKGLNEICELKPTYYQLKTQDDNSEISVGLIAQEVGEVLPEAYSEEGDFKGIGYNTILVTMINAIQELKSENDNLKSRLEVLEQS